MIKNYNHNIISFQEQLSILFLDIVDLPILKLSILILSLTALLILVQVNQLQLSGEGSQSSGTHILLLFCQCTLECQI